MQREAESCDAWRNMHIRIRIVYSYKGRERGKSSCLLYHLSTFNYIMKVILFMAVSLCT